MHARGGRTLARAGAWRGMFHVKHSSGDARTHAGRRPGRGQHADCRRRSLVRAGGGCADAGSLHVIGSPSRPRGRALGGSGSCAARGARRGLRGQAPAQGMRARGRCLRGRRSRARGGLPGRRLGQRALAQGDARAGVGVCACGQSEARRVGRPSRADSPRIDSRTARPPPRRPLALHAASAPTPPRAFSTRRFCQKQGCELFSGANSESSITRHARRGRFLRKPR